MRLFNFLSTRIWHTVSNASHKSTNIQSEGRECTHTRFNEKMISDKEILTEKQ